MNKKIRINFTRYVPFFHDGSLDRVTQTKDSLTLRVTSCEISPEINHEQIQLDEDGCMVGDVVLNGLRLISKDGNKIECFSYEHDDAAILDFRIQGNKLQIGVMWIDYPPKSDPREYCFYEVEADQILWQDACNDVTVDLTGLWTGSPPENTD